MFCKYFIIKEKLHEYVGYIKIVFLNRELINCYLVNFNCFTKYWHIFYRNWNLFCIFEASGDQQSTDGSRTRRWHQFWDSTYRHQCNRSSCRQHFLYADLHLARNNKLQSGWLLEWKYVPYCTLLFISGLKAFITICCTRSIIFSTKLANCSGRLYTDVKTRVFLL